MAPVPKLLKLFWHVAEVVVVFGLLSGDVEFEVSLETLCLYVKLMLSSSEAFAFNHLILACLGFL